MLIFERIFYKRREGQPTELCLDSVQLTDEDFYLEGRLHDLQYVGGVLLQKTHFSDGEILLQFLYRTKNDRF